MNTQRSMASLLLSVLALLVVAAVFAAGLALTLRGPAPTGDEYAALFANTSSLKEGEDVRAAGVTVGRVSEIEVQPDNLVKVVFELQDGFPIRTDTVATVKYKNLLNDRYVALSPGPGPGQALEPGGVIPVTQTHPALSLDELYNGFSPLFEGLQPDQVNQLTGSLVAVLQGEGSSVDRLLTQTGSLTSTLADRDQVIGSLIDNLNGILATLDGHHEELDRLVVELTDLVRGLNKDRQRIGESVEGINDLTESLSDLLRDVRPELKDNVRQVDRLASVINEDQEELDELLERVPGYYPIATRVGSYASAFQFYLCGVQLRIDNPDPSNNPLAPTFPPILTPITPVPGGEQRCQY